MRAFNEITIIYPEDEVFTGIGALSRRRPARPFPTAAGSRRCRRKQAVRLQLLTVKQSHR